MNEIIEIDGIKNKRITSDLMEKHRKLLCSIADFDVFDEAVQLEAVKKKSYAIRYIHNPYDSVLKYNKYNLNIANI